MDVAELSVAMDQAPTIKGRWLYRLFDASGDLLYIGVARRIHSRVLAHRRKPWGREIAAVQVQWYDAERLALKAERIAIRSEPAKYNKRSVPRVGQVFPPDGGLL